MSSQILSNLQSGYQNMATTYGNQAAGYGQMSADAFSDLGDALADYLAAQEGRSSYVGPTGNTPSTRGGYSPIN